MKCFTLFLTLLLLNVAPYAEVGLDEVVSNLNQLADTATDALTNCEKGRAGQKFEIELKGDPGLYHQKIELSVTGSGEAQSFENDSISVLTKEEAEKLFQEFSQITYMKFDYLHDGCFARAHEFALIAKENGIEMGKVFLSDTQDKASLYPKEWRDNDQAPVPSGFYGWRYHVTPYVLVKEGDKLVPYVFDVGVTSGPKAIEEWRKDSVYRESETELVYRDRAFMFADGGYSSEGKSNIESQLKDQELMRSLGINEYLFRLEQGWL